ncbi:MAG TPA: dihydroorotase family protein, partial [Nitrososphaerales archaeon]|nr:dihydroorotase family protein [Nitrososphaerales archaeon]
FPGVETSLVLMLDQVKKRRLDIARLSLLMSENPAKAFGLFPRKGALMLGSQADIAVVDFQEEKINARDLHSKCGWTPFEGRKVSGRVQCTILAGKVVYRDSELVEAGQGNLITRTTSLHSR